MGLSDKIAVIGHNGWAAKRNIDALAAQPFEQTVRILARQGSNIKDLPDNVEVARYSWDDQTGLVDCLQGVDILISFIGHEGLKDQANLIQPIKQAKVKLFVPSDLALPYTVEERTNVQVPREKYELELQLTQESIPFVLICIGNFTSFALDSPYMGIDLPNNRIVHTGKSRDNPVWLSSRNYVAAGFASIFSTSTPAELAGRLIGLNELHPTTSEIEQAMYEHTGRQPQVANETVENMTQQAAQGRLDALVRKKMGDGSHQVGNDIWEVEGFQKQDLAYFIREDPRHLPPYVPPSEETLHFLDHYFE